MDGRTRLEKEFYARVPKARRISPVFRAFFDMMYAAHERAVPGSRVLNIYASKDFSGNREEVYREEFFKGCEYAGVDFWQDRFIREGAGGSPGEPHRLPFPDAQFDVVVTTKIILEHISDPQTVIREFFRVLKPNGEVFFAAPLVRRQHQKPFDYYRYTEFALERLLKDAGFSDIRITHSNGFLATVAAYAYFFQRGLRIPGWLERVFDWIGYWAVEPTLYFLDRFDDGYGRDMTLYFMVRARKPQL